MVLGKVRNNRRTSGTSYTSTVTMVIFIALCVLGVWMLTSNSVVPPETTTRTDTTTTTNSAAYSSPTTESDNTKPTNKIDSQDKPGQLPVDAIKSDETNQDKKSQEDQKDSRNIEISGDNNMNTDKQENSRSEDKNVEGNVIKEVDSVVPENPQGLQGKESAKEQEKQKAQETQVSEESSMTVRSQQVEATMRENQNISSNKNSEKEAQKGEVIEQTQKNHAKVDNPANSQDTQHQISDKDQQKEQSQKGATSDDQVQHDEAPLDSTKPQVENQQTRRNDPQKESNLTQETKQVENKPLKLNSNESVLEGANSGIPKESKESKKSWSTQADQSENQKERGNSEGQDGSIYGYTWQLCNVSAGPDYIPCLDNEKALRHLRTTRHYEHRERHCPEEGPTCLVPNPEGYKRPIEWPESRDKIWYNNAPHTNLVEVKGHQNWIKVMGEYLTFPGGGTQFIHGALH